MFAASRCILHIGSPEGTGLASPHKRLVPNLKAFDRYTKSGWFSLEKHCFIYRNTLAYFPIKIG